MGRPRDGGGSWSTSGGLVTEMGENPPGTVGMEARSCWRRSSWARSSCSGFEGEGGGLWLEWSDRGWARLDLILGTHEWGRIGEVLPVDETGAGKRGKGKSGLSGKVERE